MIGDDNSVLRQLSARLKTSSAVVPALLASLIAMPIGAAGIAFGPPSYGVLFGFILASPLFVALLQIIFFTLFDRDRLHNEEHIERRMQIDRGQATIVDNRTGAEILIEGGSVSPEKLENGK